MCRLLAAVLLSVWTLVFPHTRAHASATDGHFPHRVGISSARWTVAFHPGADSQPKGDLLRCDAAGQRKTDAFWEYTWDPAGRLTGMTRRAGTHAQPGVTSEQIAYGYDADGRRITRTRAARTKCQTNS